MKFYLIALVFVFCASFGAVRVPWTAAGYRPPISASSRRQHRLQWLLRQHLRMTLSPCG